MVIHVMSYKAAHRPSYQTAAAAMTASAQAAVLAAQNAPPVVQLPSNFAESDKVLSAALWLQAPSLMALRTVLVKCG